LSIWHLLSDSVPDKESQMSQSKQPHILCHTKQKAIFVGN